MPINKSTGDIITADDIRNEFGPTGTVSFADYRVNESHGSLSNMKLDRLAGPNKNTDIPSTGVITFENFYNSRLNVVVKITHNDSVAKTVYNNNNTNNVKVIGGLRSRPTNTAGRRIYINVNQTIGGSAAQSGIRNACALTTGEWVNGAWATGAGTSVSVDIGGSGKIYGNGGRGGNGSNSGGDEAIGGRGGDGSSALGIEFGASNNKVHINNTGYIQAGYGGGGGGGGWNSPSKEAEDHTAGGGGGGGGAGFIIGEGGTGGSGWKNQKSGDGGDGGTQDGGGGGAGGSKGGAEGGEGGAGGEPSSNAGDGTEAGGDAGGGDGGEGGDNGYAIINENAATAINYSNSGGPYQSGTGSKVGDTATGVNPL